jgi:hypothetical protein
VEHKILAEIDYYDTAVNFYLKGEVERAEGYFKQASKAGFRAADLWLHSINPEHKSSQQKSELAFAFDWLSEQDQNQGCIQHALGFCYI